MHTTVREKARIYPLPERKSGATQRPIEVLQRAFPEHKNKYYKLRELEAAHDRCRIPLPDYEKGYPKDKVDRYTESAE